MGMLCNNISILQDKDGVVVARIKSNANSFIIKYFMLIGASVLRFGQQAS